MSAPRPTIVLLHGLGGSTERDFGFLLPMLARQHAVIGIDLGDGTLEQTAARVSAEIAARVPHGDVALVGFSFGALVALEVAALAGAAADARVTSLVLAAGVLAAGERQRVFAETWQTLESNPQALDSFARFAAIGSAFESGGAAPVSTGGGLAGPAAPTGPAASAPFLMGATTNSQVAIIGSVDLSASAERVTVPTLVIAGLHDAIAGRQQSARLFGAIADARLAEISTGHAMLAERPAELLSLIDSFVREPGRYPAGTLLPEATP